MKGLTAAPRRPVSWLGACSWSAGIHAVLLLGAAVAGIWVRFPEPPFSREEIATELQGSASRHLADMSVEPVQQGLQAMPLLSANALQELIQQEFQDRFRQSRHESVARESERLEELAARLQSVSSATGVQEMTGAILDSLGAAPRPAVAPVVDSPAAFDHQTAQINDVMKSRTDEGTVRYEAVLIDGAGRALRIELEPPEGEQLFRIFETMRQFPLLRQVYRELAMPLLDRMLETHSAAGATGGTTSANGPHVGVPAGR